MVQHFRQTTFDQPAEAPKDKAWGISAFLLIRNKQPIPVSIILTYTFGGSRKEMPALVYIL